MSIKINLGKWGSVFAIPKSVVDDDLKLASGKQLKVLLYILRHNDEEIDETKVGSITGMDDEDVADAVAFWKERGVLSPIAVDNSPEKSTASPVNEATEANEKTVEKKKPRPLSRVQKPDSVFVAQRLKNDQMLSQLLEEVQKLFGKPLSSGDTATLVMLHDTDGLPCDVLFTLISYCHTIGKDNMRYIEKMAVGWASEDITTMERADKKLAQLEKYGLAWNNVSRIFGLSNDGSPTKAQQENANRWLNEWNFSEEMLREAYERCVNKKNTFSLTYTNGILKNWKKYNINSLKELNDFESKKSTDSKKTTGNKTNEKSSYNIDEYEDFSMFD